MLWLSDVRACVLGQANRLRITDSAYAVIGLFTPYTLLSLCHSGDTHGHQGRQCPIITVIWPLKAQKQDMAKKLSKTVNFVCILENTMYTLFEATKQATKSGAKTC
jgi:hypothetical protein